MHNVREHIRGEAPSRGGAFERIVCTAQVLTRRFHDPSHERYVGENFPLLESFHGTVPNPGLKHHHVAGLAGMAEHESEEHGGFALGHAFLECAPTLGNLRVVVHMGVAQHDC